MLCSVQSINQMDNLNLANLIHCATARLQDAALKGDWAACEGEGETAMAYRSARRKLVAHRCLERATTYHGGPIPRQWVDAELAYLGL